MASPVSSVADANERPRGPPMRQLDLDAQSYLQRGLEKCKQQPFVPLGALFTCIALGGAFRELRRGNSQKLNKYLRLRVMAQGATVAAMVAGSYFYTSNVKPEEEQQALEERQRMLQVIAAAGTPKEPLPQEQTVEDASVSSKPKRVQYVVRKDGSGDSLGDFWRKTEGESTTPEPTSSAPPASSQATSRSLWSYVSSSKPPEDRPSSDSKGPSS